MITIESKAAEIRVMITTAGRENLLFRTLLRQAVPLLRCPEKFTDAERQALLESMRSALDDASVKDDEPGCPEEPQK